eukprot:comp11547_c0_seq1/m.6010 comp11547_c0_seq1/g.6010  ORF comp11547_c0_seq1/g.6010 comp11547_c0_seq1/m.6010 type:complete len:549 (-) comp11547_c0_seq1:261-1907(-)
MMLRPLLYRVRLRPIQVSASTHLRTAQSALCHFRLINEAGFNGSFLLARSLHSSFGRFADSPTIRPDIPDFTVSPLPPNQKSPPEGGQKPRNSRAAKQKARHERTANQMKERRAHLDTVKKEAHSIEDENVREQLLRPRTLVREDRDREYNLAQGLHALVTAGKVSYALSVLEEAESPTDVHYNTVLKGLAIEGKGKATLELFNRMKKAGVKPTAITYSTLLEAFARSDGDSLKKAEKILNEMKSKDFEPNLTVYNNYLKVVSRHGTLADCFTVLEQIEQALLHPDSYTYSHMLETAIRTGTREDMDRVWMLMRKHHTKSSQAYTRALSVCKSQDNPSGWRLGLKIYEAMIKDGVVPSRHIITTMLDLCDKSGYLQGLDQLLDTMVKIKEQPDLPFYNELASIYAKHKGTDELWRLYAMIKNRKLEPDSYTLRSMIRGAQSRDQVEILLADMEHYRIRMNEHIAAALLQTGLHLKDYDLIIKTAEEMLNLKIAPSEKYHLGSLKTAFHRLASHQRRRHLPLSPQTEKLRSIKTKLEIESKKVALKRNM